MADRILRTVFFSDVNSPFGIPHFFELLEIPGCEVVGLVLAPPRDGDVTGPMPVPDRYGLGMGRDLLARACDLGIPVLRSENLSTVDCCRNLALLAPDLLVSAGFRKIVPPEVLQIPRQAAVNFHPAKLPRMRGSDPCFWAIKHGELESAATVHHMVQRVDAGDIILQTPIRVADDDTYSTLQHKAIVESLRLVGPLVQGLIDGSSSRIPQDETRALTFSGPKHEDYRIDWSKPSRQVYNLVRASLSAPGAWTTFQGKTIRLTRAEIGTDPALLNLSRPIGTLLKLSPHAAVIKTGDGMLIVREIQFEGKIWKAPDFISAARCNCNPEAFV